MAPQEIFPCQSYAIALRIAVNYLVAQLCRYRPEPSAVPRYEVDDLLQKAYDAELIQRSTSCTYQDKLAAMSRNIG